MTLTGAAAPNFKHGLYSKYFPANLARVYESAVNDPDLLSLRNEVALLQVRLEELLGRLSTGEHADLWSELKESYTAMTAALRGGDLAATNAAMAQLGQLIAAGVDHEAIWKELHETIHAKTDVAAKEWHRLVSLKQLITAERAMLLIGGIMECVRRNVSDAAALARIADQVNTVLVTARPAGETRANQ